MNLKITFFTLMLSLMFLASAQGQSLDTGNTGFFNAPAPTERSLSQPYPNPASHSTQLKFNLGNDSQGKIQVYNLLGTRIKSYVLHNESGEISIPVHELQSGIYFLRLEVNGKETLMRKLKVMR